jgi:DNA-binding MarR family transcriptional regulator
MEQFVVGIDGLLSEVFAAEQAAWFGGKSLSADPIDFEAHFMLMRGFEALKIEAPFERGGVSKARFGILRLLCQAEDHRMVMSEIVQRLNVSPTNITKLVDGLERGGYVRRVGNALDKRRIWVELLPAGKEIVDELMPSVVEHIHMLWSGLSNDEKRVLVHLVSKLRLSILTGAASNQVECVGQRLEAVEAGS